MTELETAGMENWPLILVAWMCAYVEAYGMGEA
jgi:hypothetical protein